MAHTILPGGMIHVPKEEPPVWGGHGSAVAVPAAGDISGSGRQGGGHALPGGAAGGICGVDALLGDGQARRAGGGDPAGVRPWSSRGRRKRKRRKKNPRKKKRKSPRRRRKKRRCRISTHRCPRPWWGRRPLPSPAAVHTPTTRRRCWRSRPRWTFSADEPTILILHTHASESYTPEPGQSYETAGSFAPWTQTTR